MDVQCHMGPIIPAALVTSQLDSDVVTHSHPFILHLLRISQRRFGAFAVLHCWRCYGQTTNHYLNKQQQEPRCWPMFDRNWELCPKSHEGEEVSNRTCTKPQRQAYRRDSDSEQPPFPGSWRLMGADQSCGLPGSEQEPYPTWWCDNSKFTLNALLKVFFSEISENRSNMFLFLIKNNSLSSDCDAWSAFKRDLLAVFNTA